ncbi:MAG: acyltransferase family protein [Lachnospiraceae bacterium]|nr:acyltransferase family protein [Lachnospiraceae bacterium]
MEIYDTKNRQRMDWIDAAKGIAAILVVLVHAYAVSAETSSDFLINTVSSLHNPAFYLCSGILFSIKGTEKSRMKTFFNKALDLLLPFAVWCILYSVYAKALIHIVKSDYAYSYWNTMNKLWFLPILFFAFCVTMFFEKLHLKTIYAGGILAASVITGAFISSMLAKIACFTFIFYIGTRVKSIGKKKKYIGIFSIVVWSAVIIVCYMTGLITQQDNFRAGVKLLIMLVSYIVGAIGFTYVIYSLAEKLPGYIMKIFQYIGQNTLYIYILHFLFIYYLEIVKCNNIICILCLAAAALIFPIIFAKSIRGRIVDKILFKPSKIMK